MILGRELNSPYVFFKKIMNIIVKNKIQEISVEIAKNPEKFKDRVKLTPLEFWVSAFGLYERYPIYWEMKRKMEILLDT